MRSKLLTMLNQSISSATNFGGTALAAGLLTSENFGAFAVAISVLTIALGFARTWSGLVLMVTAPGCEQPKFDDMLAGAVGISCVIGAAAGGGVAAFGVFVGGPTGTALVALGPCLLFVVVQDAYRHGALARRELKSANLSDGAWLIGTIVSLMILRRLDFGSLPLAVIASTAPAGIGLLVGAQRAHVVPSWRGTKRTFHQWTRLSTRLSLEFIVAVSSNIATLVILTAWNADLQQAGALKSAQVLLGPLAVLFATSTFYLQPTMVARHREGRSILTLARNQSIVNTLAAVLWVVVARFTPGSVGTRVFGESWVGLQHVIVLVGASFVAAAISSGAITALRSRGQLTAGLAAQTVSAVIVIALTIGGGLLLAEGTLRGFAAGCLVASGVAWFVALRWPVNDIVTERPPALSPQ